MSLSTRISGCKSATLACSLMDPAAFALIPLITVDAATMMTMDVYFCCILLLLLWWHLFFVSWIRKKRTKCTKKERERREEKKEKKGKKLTINKVSKQEGLKSYTYFATLVHSWRVSLFFSFLFYVVSSAVEVSRKVSCFFVLFRLQLLLKVENLKKIHTLHCVVEIQLLQSLNLQKFFVRFYNSQSRVRNEELEETAPLFFS